MAEKDKVQVNIKVPPKSTYEVDVEGIRLNHWMTEDKKKGKMVVIYA